MRSDAGLGERGSDADSSHHDPLTADRRTLVIALIAMFALVGVGVVSAAVFTGSACDDVGPDPIVAPVAGTSVPEVVSQAFDQLDDAGRVAVVDGLSGMAELFGAVSGIADVGGAERLAPLGSGFAALGPRSTALEAGGSEVRGAVEFADPAVVVGDGATVYSVALANELTGQLDAIQALDADLEPIGHCLDTATVNVPFAFHLAANDGDLLVFRSDEDAGSPELELRGRSGSEWTAPFEVAVAPPGLLGERITGWLGEELVVAARRVVPGESAAAVTAVARTDGEQRWSVAPSDLPDLGDGPLWIEVMGVADDTVVLAVADEAARDERWLVALDADDGAIVWADEQAQVVLDVTLTGGEVLELVQDGEGTLVRRIEPEGGGREVVATMDADVGRLVALEDGRHAVIAGSGVLVLLDREQTMLGAGAPVVDLTVDPEGRVTALVAVGPDAVAVTFGS